MANMASACALVMSTGDSNKLFGPLRHWRAKEAASTCILVTISTVCVLILVVCGVLLAREYSLAKGYERTWCSVSNVTDTGQERTCQCAGYKDKIKDRQVATPGGCVVSSFPCMRVSVMYSANSAVHEALLHLDSIQAIGIYRECSFSVCGKDKDENYRAAHEFADRWRSRQRADPFECYYNTADYDDVIAEKLYTQSDVIHSMLWPSVVIVVCCAVFLRLETRRRHLTFCGSAPPESSTECSRGPTPDALDMRAVLRGGGGPTCSGFRFPGPNGSVECRLVTHGETDKKPWKSYSSLEHLITTPRKSVTAMSRDSAKHVTDMKSRSADLLVDSSSHVKVKSKLSDSVESGVQLRIDDELIPQDQLVRKMSAASADNPTLT